jgi:glycosyltransferase involved in cell wall biosynthesis
MDYFPNQQAMATFCHEVMPIVRRHRPSIRLQIVGADPSPSVRRLGRQDGVTVTGSVPDVRPYIRRSALTVAPLSIARGTQNKILESMAMGVPVIASHTASGGIDAIPGEHLLSAQTAEEFAAAIVELVCNPRARAELSAAGRARVLEYHDWGRSMERLDGLLAGLLGTGV